MSEEKKDTYHIERYGHKLVVDKLAEVSQSYFKLKAIKDLRVKDLLLELLVLCIHSSRILLTNGIAFELEMSFRNLYLGLKLCFVSK